MTRPSWSVFDELRRSVFSRLMEEYARLVPEGSNEDAPSAFGVVDIAIAVVLQPDVPADQVGRGERTIGVARLRDRRRSGPPIESTPAPPHSRAAYGPVTRQLGADADPDRVPSGWEHSSPQSSVAATLVDRACDRVAAELQRDSRTYATW